MMYQPSPSTIIALNLSKENNRVHERVDALINLAYFYEVFWKNQSKAATVAKFQDRVHQVHRFFLTNAILG
jgi:hypothetical protein